MPPRNHPTARQARLGAELRKMRERAGLTAREAAAQLGVTPMRMSHIEIGRLGVSEERLRKFATHYGCSDSAYIDALAGLTGRQERGWWETFKGCVTPADIDLVELEWHAQRLASLQIVYIPGLLQTASYTRALFRYLRPDAEPSDFDAVVEFRGRRRAVLDRASPVPFTAIIHEAALRMKVGDRRLAREQLDFLLESIARPGVTVRVVPFSADGFAGMGSSMLYAAGRVPELDTVLIDHVHGSVFLDAADELVHYRDRLRRAESSALGPEETKDLIRRIAQEL
ncbi:helix-turn-helix transcriptional regulator [Streptomyces sp. NPDC049585]|uniref:helix-turn-helix domain-containing protein n=1 Tax=Streptomyces sp. NPDC049585 TaxID=3155154 RepID=UPI003419CDEF